MTVRGSSIRDLLFRDRPRVVGRYHVWFRYDNYELIEHKGEILVVPTKGAQLLTYLPFHDPNIVHDFLRVGKTFCDNQSAFQEAVDRNRLEEYRRRDAYAVLRFCSKYGLLGLILSADNLSAAKRQFGRGGELFFPYGFPSGQFVHGFPEIGDRAWLRYAEPAGVFALMASELFLNAKLVQYFIENQPRMDETIPAPIPVMMFTDGATPTWSVFISRLHIHHISMLLLLAPGGHIDLEFSARNLFMMLEMMLFMNLASSDKSFRLCMECSSPFVAKDPRAKFCSDRCSSRARQRRFIASHKTPTRVKTTRGLSRESRKIVRDAFSVKQDTT